MDHRRNNPNNKKQDLLEAIIDITQGNDYNFTTQDIPFLLFAKTRYKERSGREWANPGGGHRVPPGQAVIKETFRYHPPGPFSISRASEADQEVNGYMIPKGTQIVVNSWSMAKDPTIWTDPESFLPERFLENKLDFKDQHFQLIPFGAGRRICPGIPLATRILQMTTTVLVHNFDWKLKKDKDHPDHKEAMFRINLSKANPLRAFPFKI
ncbi:ferruginol synthase-like [Salvia hispanica]|uniref:ferruginol synthase-like n=1 Tax=Salvia hispanica TaxID=49212 RepID=UPI002009932E|nr:ferruginol synthase-like [Salvia hispanica]